MNTLTSPSESHSYHRLQRADVRYRWWRPLVVGLVAIGLYIGIGVATLIPVFIVGLTVPAAEVAIDKSFEATLDFGDPVGLAVLFGTLALMLPALLVANRLTGSRPAGLLSSVSGRLRLRWLRTTTVIALAIWVPVMGVWVAVEAAAGTLEVRQVAPATSVALLLVTLALVPFQAVAEEYVFRGYLGQLVGSWFRHPAFAVLLPVPLFVLGHGYGTLGTIDVAVFAVVSGWLAWRTGGLEAPIAAHVINNLVLMSLTAVGLSDPNATDTNLLGLAVSLGMLAIFTVVVTRRADALGIARTRPVTPLVEQASATPVDSTATPAALEVARG